MPNINFTCQRASGWIAVLLGLMLSIFVCGCKASNTTPNSPYAALQSSKNQLFAGFSAAPKTLDPARSYSTDSNLFIAQICEPPLQYHYLKRPYLLMPLAAARMPVVRFWTAKMRPTSQRGKVAYTTYDIYLRDDLQYAPHPAFAKNAAGEFLYHQQPLDHINLSDRLYGLQKFGVWGSRHATASDFVYEIKRLADPMVGSPIFSVMAKHIKGFTKFNQELSQYRAKHKGYLDLRQFSIDGVQVIDDQHYQIILKGQYPQFIYWLAMPFFAPVPPEVDKFYQQPGMHELNFSFDWQPVGTGAFFLAKNDPNSAMILQKNPNFRLERYPETGMPADQQRGYLVNAGRALPLLDRVVFSLEKESIPGWHKFLQGFYDRSGISSDSFDQAIRIDKNGKPDLTKKLAKLNMRLDTTISPSIFYFGFNMLDSVVGGASLQSRYLRQAISIAIDIDEYIRIFLNGRGQVAMGPLPPGIWGSNTEVINPYIYRMQQGVPVRRSLAYAKQLMQRAGYKDGIDAKTGRALVLHYDVPASNGPDDKAKFDWMREQFMKLGIALDIRATQYNRFQSKMRTGQSQIFMWGWHADYPDPENFLFLLYGPNGKVAHHGENAANYNSSEFNKCFLSMKNLPNNPVRRGIIDRCIKIIQRDSPWIFGFYPKTFILSHNWVAPIKANSLAGNVLKYYALNPKQRSIAQVNWNHPRLGALILLLILLVAGLLYGWRYYRQKMQKCGIKRIVD